MFVPSVLFALLYLPFVLAKPLLHQRQNKAQKGIAVEPCTLVQNEADSQRAANPTVAVVVAAELAMECLASVPLGAPQAMALVKSMLPFVEWQSDISYLSKPPAGYAQPGVDLRAGFSDIMNKITANQYSGEYAFQKDIVTLVNRAYDGHFRFAPDLMVKALTFRRPMAITSISQDGVGSPRIFSAMDVLQTQKGAKYQMSAITTIDGQPAEAFAQNFSKLMNGNDPDANYNFIFYQTQFAAVVAGGWQGTFAGSGAGSIIYPGPNTTFGFENGTTRVVQNFAVVGRRFANITDGQSLYQKVCTGPDPVVAAPPAAAPAPVPNLPDIPMAAPPKVQPAGYPTPVVVTQDMQLSGYYLENTNVAVLSINSFEASSPPWQATIAKFIATAKQDGKSKMIIDVSVNGGGIIFQGYDTFRQFFPQIQEDGNNRFRVTPAFEVAAEQTTRGIPADYIVSTNGDLQLLNLFASPANFRFDSNITNQPFANPVAKFGPAIYNDDKFTNIIRWDFNDSLLTTNTSTGVGIEITGYGTRANITQQPFASQDLLIITDGFCASTCTLFTEEMRSQGNVKTVVFGGRPFQGVAPITQAIGGVKGANSYAYSDITALVQTALDSGTPEQRKQANWTSMIELTNTLPINRSTDANVNVRDAIRRSNVADGVPAQFIYEPADCRMLLTAPMIANVTNIWMAAAKAAWGGGKCAAGSLPAVKVVDGPKSAFSQMIGPTKAKMMMDVEFTPGFTLDRNDKMFMRERFMKVDLAAGLVDMDLEPNLEGF